VALAGRCALITGATSGIGRALALALAARGARVAIAGRDPARLTEAASAARAQGAERVVEVAADLARPEGIEAIAARVRESFDCLDVLVHAAGLVVHGGVADGRVEDLDAQFATNVRAPYLLTQRLLPLLLDSRGEIVFVNSSVVSFPRAEVAQYAASKHALRGLADCLRQEVNPHGVRVLSIFPGRTATAGQEAIHVREGRAYRPAALLQPEDVAAAVCSALELPRTAELTDIHLRPLAKN
jgi:NAD(P)-dependent dehydrogenase (short-subunit alcohol dehydrogenase family)